MDILSLFSGISCLEIDFDLADGGHTSTFEDDPDCRQIMASVQQVAS